MSDPETRPDAAPPEDDGTADPEDAFVPRDENGEVAEVRTVAQGMGAVTVRPMVYGQAERYFGDAGGVAQAGPAVVAEIIHEHVLDPDYDAYVRENEVMRSDAETDRREGDLPNEQWLTETVVKEHMTPFAPQALLMAVLRESGLDVKNLSVSEDGEATIEFEDEGN